MLSLPKYFLISLVLILCGCAGSRSRLLHEPGMDLARLAHGAEGSSSLFTSYAAHAPARWNSGWPWKLDLTGVAWDRSNTATVITPRHVVMASHYYRKAGDEIVFHDRKGRRHVRIVEQVVHLKDRGIQSDVAVGLLNRPLPSSIRWYPLPAPDGSGGKSLVGRVVLVTEQNRDLYFHKVADTNGQMVLLQHDPGIPAHRSKGLIAGDSGHPSFLLAKGELVLLETHTGGGAGVGPFYGSAALQEVMRRIVQETDAAYQLRTVRVE